MRLIRAGCLNQRKTVSGRVTYFKAIETEPTQYKQFIKSY